MSPACNLSPDIIRNIRNDIFEAEQLGRLTPPQLELIDRERWFHLFVPQQYGGLGLSLPDAVRLEEQLAHADGSLGWVVTLCAGAALFVGYLEPDLAARIFGRGNRVCLAGSGQTGGNATTIDGGYEVSGSWAYASGAPHATHFTANCRIDGSSEVRSFIFDKADVKLQPNWRYIGLTATAGYSFSVSRLRVSKARSFVIDAAHAVLPDAIYRYPFLQLAEATIAANVFGMGRRFVELAADMLAEKTTLNARSEGVKKRGIELAENETNALSTVAKTFYKALDESWLQHVSNGASGSGSSALSAVSHASRMLSKTAIEAVNHLYPFCGLHAARTDAEINQVWRNVHTASQHSLLV